MSPESRYLVLGTAGHIDHGKTSLVRALTGIDTDRLAEEKARGITIDLGFAHWTLPDGTQLGIIDMPGHRRFIRNMVAGAAGIDLLLLIVAADDGVMPQTVEHLQIARLLGVKSGLVALTKSDLVDDDLRQLAVADVEALVKGSFLDGAPIVPVSSTTGDGLPELTAQIQQLAARATLPSGDAPFRLPIDRAFTIKGAGTVVTGTILAGTVQVDDELAIMPDGRRVRVRGLQLHGESVTSIGPRHRAALNLVGVDKDEIARGDVLAGAGSLEPTELVDVRLELLAGGWRPLRRGGWAEVHIGTAEVGAKLSPLEGETMAAGSTSLVQLKLIEPIACAAGDRFILRGPEGDETIGGGVVLDPHPTLHRRRRDDAARDLSELSADETLPLAALLRHEVAKSPLGLDRTEAGRLLNAGPAALAEAVEALLEDGSGLAAHRDGRSEVLTLPENRARIGAAIEKSLAAWHAAHPLTRRGLSAAELAQAAFPAARIPLETVRLVLEEGIAGRRLAAFEGSFALASHKGGLSERDTRAAAEIAKRLEASLAPEQPEDFLPATGLTLPRLRQVLDHLRETGEAVLAPGGVFFGGRQVEAARDRLRAHLRDAQAAGITVSQANQLLGTTRKYGIPLLQLFENEGWLARDGDLRKLKG
jgi:selenocysteine-specific elongation factor